MVDSYISSLQTKVCGQIDHLEFGSDSLGATRSQGSKNNYLFCLTKQRSCNQLLTWNSESSRSRVSLSSKTTCRKILRVIDLFCRAGQTVRLLDVLRWEQDGIVGAAPSLMQLRALVSSALALPRCTPFPFWRIIGPVGQQNDAKLLFHFFQTLFWLYRRSLWLFIVLIKISRRWRVQLCKNLWNSVGRHICWAEAPVVQDWHEHHSDCYAHRVHHMATHLLVIDRAIEIWTQVSYRDCGTLESYWHCRKDWQQKGQQHVNRNCLRLRADFEVLDQLCLVAL